MIVSLEGFRWRQAPMGHGISGAGRLETSLRPVGGAGSTYSAPRAEDGA